MPIEMAIPFKLSSDGTIAVETNPDRQISQRIHALVGTEPGERVMRADLGVPLTTLLFEPDSYAVQIQIETAVREGLAQYEPGAFIARVTPLVNTSGDGFSGVEVDFSRTEAATSPAVYAKSINTAVISVGGRVSEVIRG